MKRMKRIAGLVLSVVVGFACLAQADAKDDARARRKERRAQIVELVQAGQAQEGDNGYLVAKPDLSPEKASLVKAENEDRRIGYTAIAQANGKTVEEIGRQAAAINKARADKRLKSSEK